MPGSPSPTLSKVHSLELRLLRELDRVCLDHGLTYFAAYGTALGAYRERGPIAWDWDADVLVPMVDYPKLIGALTREVSDGIAVVTPETDPDYPPLFARLTIKAVDQSLVHVDIFPLASAPEAIVLRWPLYVLNRLLSRLHVMKRVELTDRAFYSWHKRLLTVVVKKFMAPVPAAAIRRAHTWLNARFRSDSRLVQNPCGSYGMREYFPRDWFSANLRRAFDAQQINLPIAIDEYLTQLYGSNYQQPISRGEQAKAYRFFDTYCAPRLLFVHSTDFLWRDDTKST